MRLLLLLALLPSATLPAAGQTLRWFRAHTRPSPFEVTSCTNATPVVCTTKEPHQLQVGDTIVINNGRVDAGGATSTWASANGLRRIISVPTSTTFSLSDIFGVPLAGNGTWVLDVYNWTGTANTQAPAFGVRVQQYPTAEHPRGYMFDGLTGISTRRMATRTANGLTSLVVAGNVATVTLTYNHGLVTGNKVGVFNATNSLLNGDKTITVSGAQTFTYPAVIADGSYYNSSTTVSQYAHAGNPLWAELQNNATACDPNGIAGDGHLNAAVYWWVTLNSTAFTCAKRFLLGFETRYNNYYPIDPDEANGGNADTDFISTRLQLTGMMYSLLRGGLTSEEKTTIYNKLWRSESCTPNYIGKSVAWRGFLKASSTTQDFVLDSNASPVDNFYRGDRITIERGKAANSTQYRIMSYVGATRTATITSPATMAPDATSQARIESGNFTDALIFAHGALQSATSTTATLATSAIATTHYYTYVNIRITSGTGIGQIRQITGYASSRVATIDSPWTTIPSPGDSYEVYSGYDHQTVGYSRWADEVGTLSAVTNASTVTLGANAAIYAAQYSNEPHLLRMTTGVAAGEERFIFYYSGAKVAYLLGDFSATPSAGDSYIIINMSTVRYRYADHAGTLASAGANNVTLNASAGSTDYTGDFVYFTSGPATGLRLRITTYSTSTRVATFTAPFPGGTQAGAGDSYRIDSGDQTSRPVRTVVRIPTGRLLTDPDVAMRPAVGMMANQILSGFSSQALPISAVTETTLTIDDDIAIYGEQLKWWPAALTPGSCGAYWALQHHPTRWGTPVVYKPQGGITDEWSHNLTVTGARAVLSALLGFIDDFPDLEILTAAYSTYYLDRVYENYAYSTGFNPAGSYYGTGRTLRYHMDLTDAIRNTLPTWPDLSGSTAFREQLLAFWAYNYPGFADPLPLDSPPVYEGGVWWGTENSNAQLDPYSPVIIGVTTTFLPRMRGTLAAQQHRSWLLDRLNLFASFGPLTVPQLFAYWDPNDSSSDYRDRPLQRIFRVTDLDTCTNAAISCTPGIEMGGFFSHSAWGLSHSSTVVYGHCNDWIRDKTGPDHAVPECGQYRIYAGTPMVGVDSGETVGYHEGLTSGGGGAKLNKHGNIPIFAGSDIPPSTAGTVLASMPRAAMSDNRYAYVTMDLTKYYSPSTVGGVRIHRHIAHMKAPGRDHLVVVYDDWQTSQVITHAAAIHYSQNGGTNNQLGPEGTTTCPGVANCTLMNTTRLVRSVPSPTIAPTSILTRVFDVTQLLVKSENADGTYTGGRGKTHQVQYCRSVDGTTCTATTATEALVVHKILQNQTEDTFSPTRILTSKWAGVESADTVVLFRRNGQLDNQLSFSTGHGGTASYLITGLEPGTYTVVRGGTTVGTFTAADGSNSIYYESVSGSFSISANGTTLRIDTTTLPNAVQFGRYSTNLTASGGTAPYTWRIAAGALCERFTLQGDGLLSGTPVSSDLCTFTVEVRDSVGSTALQPLTLRVDLQPLAARLFVRNTTAVVKYGYPGLGPSQSCTLHIERDGEIEATWTDVGGASRRVATFPGLPPGTNLQLMANCGAASLVSPLSFLTGPPFDGQRCKALRIGQPRNPSATKAAFYYGAIDPDILISLQNCDSGCMAETPELPLGSILKWRLNWKNDAGQTLGGGSPRLLVVW